MLHVVIVGENLSAVQQHIKACEDTYAFKCSFTSLKASLQEVAEGMESLFAFVEAPKEDRGNESADTWVLLKELQAAKGRLARAFVVSTGEDFDSDEAQKAWMHYSIVVGYELQNALSLEEVRVVLSEMVALAADRSGGELPRPVGSVLKMPAGEYERHKFVSLFIGGMREVLVNVRQVAEAMKQHNPSPKVSGKLSHPFAEKSAHELFDEAVKEVHGYFERQGQSPSSIHPSIRRPPKGMPKWLLELKENRATGYATPHLLLLGETGTGKSLLARWLHRMRFEGAADTDDWRLVDKIFQDFNCGGISPNLIDSQLFGGVAGAWTSLDHNTPGKIFCACHGTLFLDEIGTLPLQTQSVLLKFLDDGEYQPVGWHGERLFIPVTVIAATNQPIERLVAEGKFRLDLYERFRFRIRIPSLRERIDHFDHLVDFVLQNPQINPIADGERVVNAISPIALSRLRGYHWRGNFRELEQALWRAVFQAANEGSDIIQPRHIILPSEVSPYPVRRQEAVSSDQ